MSRLIFHMHCCAVAMSFYLCLTIPIATGAVICQGHEGHVELEWKFQILKPFDFDILHQTYQYKHMPLECGDCVDISLQQLLSLTLDASSDIQTSTSFFYPNDFFSQNGLATLNTLIDVKQRGPPLKVIQAVPFSSFLSFVVTIVMLI